MADRILDRRYRDREVEAPPVLSETNGFKMIEAFAAPDAREDLLFLVLAIRWNQSDDRRADHFVGGVSEDALGPEIPTGDDTVQILSDDRIVGRGDDRRQPVRSDVGQMPIGHVAETPHAARSLSIDGEDFGITLKNSPIFQFQQIEALSLGRDDLLEASDKPLRIRKILARQIPHLA